MVKQANFKPALRIEPAELRKFVAALFEAAGGPPATATLMADLLVDNDLHGASSHGTNLPHGWRYLQQMRAGELNPAPVPTVISESGACRVYDGDGGGVCTTTLIAPQLCCHERGACARAEWLMGRLAAHKTRRSRPPGLLPGDAVVHQDCQGERLRRCDHPQPPPLRRCSPMVKDGAEGGLHRDRGELPSVRACSPKE